MLEGKILIGGEESGGIGTSLYLPERDATVSALLLAELMAWHGKSLGELLHQLHAEFGEHHYGRLDIDVKPAQKARAVAHFSGEKLKQFLNWPVTRRENMDGVKIYLGDIGWAIVRSLGKQSLVRIYMDTSCPVTNRRVLDSAVLLI